MANNKLVTVDVLQYNNEKIKEQLNKKINIEQGVDNKGKLLGVDDTGNVALVETPDSVKVSAEADNQIEQKADGIYVKDMSAKVSVEEGNAVVLKDDGLYVPITAETKVSQAEGNAIETKEDGIYVASTDLSDYAKTEEVEKLINDELYTSTTTPSHYELADSTTDGALEVVADGTTLADGQIEQSSVTDIAVEVGDYVVFVDEVVTTDTKYVEKDSVYTKPEVDQKIADAVTGGTVDLSDYVKNEDLTTTLEDYVAEDEVKVMTVEELEELIGLNDEELEGIAQLISDTEVRIDKTYSSSKIYSELNRILEEGRTYTLSEIGKASGASYKVVSDTTGVTDTKYIYLIANANDSYDMYILDDVNGAVQIGETTIDLSGFYTKTECDDTFMTKIDATANYATKTELQEAIENVETEISTDENNQIETRENGLYVGKQYIEITQAEYDALSVEDKNNGIPYYITDARPRTGAEIVTELNNSVTDEQVPSAKVVYETVNTLTNDLDTVEDNITTINNSITTINNSLPAVSSTTLSISLNGKTGSMRFYKYGRIVYAYFSFVGEFAGADTLYTFTGTIPSGYRPCINHYVSVNGVTANKVSGQARLCFASTGAIQITSNTAAAREYLFSVCWYS